METWKHAAVLPINVKKHACQTLSKRSTVFINNAVGIRIIIAGYGTYINKGRTREFTSQITVIERQVICRMKNNAIMSIRILLKHENNHHNKEPNYARLTQ
jgi:hypothetical protein